MCFYFYIFQLLGTVMFNTFILGTEGLGGVKNVASAITCISHEQTQSNRDCCFQILDAVFPKDLFSEHLIITTAVVVSCDGPKKSPRTSICCFIYTYILVLSDYKVQHFRLHSELPRPIFQIRPRMYVRRTIMYEIAAFCSPEEHA